MKQNHHAVDICWSKFLEISNWCHWHSSHVCSYLFRSLCLAAMHSPCRWLRYGNIALISKIKTSGLNHFFRYNYSFAVVFDLHAPPPKKKKEKKRKRKCVSMISVKVSSLALCWALAQTFNIVSFFERRCKYDLGRLYCIFVCYILYHFTHHLYFKFKSQLIRREEHNFKVFSCSVSENKTVDSPRNITFVFVLIVYHFVFLMWLSQLMIWSW